MPVRRLLPFVCALLVAVGTGSPAASAQVDPGTGTDSGAAPPTAAPPNPTTTTTTLAPTAPATSSTTAAPAPAATPAASADTNPTKSPTTGVPTVPVGGPPTTAAPPGSPPPAPPSPNAILTQVDADLGQLAAISDVQVAQTFVTQAQANVTQANASVASAHQDLSNAQGMQSSDQKAEDDAASRLRQLAVDAYMGVGYTTPGVGQPPDGTAGPGTVSTPAGLTGMADLDANEMLQLVGEHARRQADDANAVLDRAVKATNEADDAYRKSQTALDAAGAQLLAAQQTLEVITTAATIPGVAAATPVAQLVAAEAAGKALTPADLPTTTTVPAAASKAAVPAAAGLIGAAGGQGSRAPDPPTPLSPTILGPSELTAAQLATWWNTLNRTPNITVPMDALIASYAKWGAALDIDFAVAFAQSIVETGSFSFPSYGQLTAQDNNFAGIGACDTCAHGWSFPDADTGVLAQLQLLHEYATTAGLPPGMQNVIGGTSVGGCCATWTELAGKWASSTSYGIAIMTVYHQMLTWLIPQQEVSAGLIPASSVAGAPGSTTGQPASATPPSATTTAARPGVSAASAKPPG